MTGIVIICYNARRALGLDLDSTITCRPFTGKTERPITNNSNSPVERITSAIGMGQQEIPLEGDDPNNMFIRETR